MFRLTTLLIAALCASQALAQESLSAPPAPPPAAPVAAEPVVHASEAKAPHDDNVQHGVSITISPIHFLLPMAEVTGEFRLANKLGVAGVVGVGSSLGLFATELGGQFRFYPIGSFIHGMQLGAEILFLSLAGNLGGASGSGVGVSLSPFIGYKIATNIGFTFDAQLGISYLAIGASATAGGQTSTASTAQMGTLLNLNVGWSF